MNDSVHDAHARFRFSVIGSLLSAPPAHGELRAAIGKLAAGMWKHPVTGEPVQYSFSTIERWYYRARDAQNPVGVLRPAIRSDAGEQPSISAAFGQEARGFYEKHPDWTFQLHYDNLRVVVEVEPSRGPLPSYPSFTRFMKRAGLVRKKRRDRETRGQARARERLEEREVRSYEVDHVGALWHLDFHVSEFISVLTPEGNWQKPILFAVLDDHSRICCHAQFYLTETAEDLIHGFGQALMKFGLCRELLSDNGSAMISTEFTEGLERLSILHRTTLPYSPYQNGKQEHFWCQVETRLMAMLGRATDLTLDKLNGCLQAWIARDYHRRFHSEIGMTPMERYADAPHVLRSLPAIEHVRDLFRRQVLRKLRRSDLTVSLEGTRFEIPSRYRELPRFAFRYASWDLSYVHLVDARTNKILVRVFPIDRSKNASGERRRVKRTSTEHAPDADGELPPLLRKWMEEYAATGLPPSYLPKRDPSALGEEAEDEGVE